MTVRKNKRKVLGRKRRIRSVEKRDVGREEVKLKLKWKRRKFFCQGGEIRGSSQQYTLT